MLNGKADIQGILMTSSKQTLEPHHLMCDEVISTQSVIGLTEN